MGFEEALRKAISDRGLTLARLSDRLAQHGFSVSTATLSYWSNGRSQPERADSLAALAVLEDVLGVESGSLRSQVGSPRRRGRTKTPSLLGVDDLWGEHHKGLVETVRRMDLPYEGRRTISVHDRYVLDETGAESLSRVTAVVEATADTVDRMLLIFQEDEGRPLPTISALAGGEIGRVDIDMSTGYLVGEFVFDHVLRRGERTVVDYQFRFAAGGRPTTDCVRRFASPVHQYALEVEFAATAVPARCYRIGPDSREPIQFGGCRVARTIVVAAPAGTYGLEWDWTVP